MKLRRSKRKDTFLVPPNTRRILILAGTYVQAVRWAESVGLSPTFWRFVDSPDSCRGYSNADIVGPLGSFFDRKDAADVMDHAHMLVKIAGCRFVDAW